MTAERDALAATDTEVLRRVIDSAWGTDGAHWFIAKTLVEAGWVGPDTVADRVADHEPPGSYARGVADGRAGYDALAIAAGNTADDAERYFLAWQSARRRGVAFVKMRAAVKALADEWASLPRMTVHGVGDTPDVTVAQTSHAYAERLRAVLASHGGCVPCRACGGSQSRGWHLHADEVETDVPTYWHDHHREVACQPACPGWKKVQDAKRLDGAS